MSISDKAILAHLDTTFSKFEKTDRRIASEMSQAKGAREGTYKAHRTLFPGCDGPLKEVLAAIEFVRTTHERNSVPWPPSRALKIEHYTTHRDRVKEAINIFELKLQNFHDQYPKLVAQGIANSNGQNSPDEYMDQSEIFKRFTVNVTYDQLMDSNDWFGSPIAPTDQTELAKQTSEAQTRILAKALDNLKTQLCNILISARDNLEKTQQEEKDGKRFNTSWLLNLQSFCQLWPGLNMDDDPLVADMISDLQPIILHSVETMKTSKQAQATSLDCLKQFITKYGDWLNS